MRMDERTLRRFAECRASWVRLAFQVTTRRKVLSRGSLSVGSASRAKMCEQAVLSTDSGSGSSKTASELERDRVAELGDAAIETHPGKHGPVMPHVQTFPRLAADCSALFVD